MRSQAPLLVVATAAWALVGCSEFDGEVDCPGVEQVTAHPVVVSAESPEPVFRATVTDPDGNPLEGEELVLWGIGPDGESIGIGGAGYTDENGEFTFNWAQENRGLMRLNGDDLVAWKAKGNDGLDSLAADDPRTLQSCPVSDTSGYMVEPPFSIDECSLVYQGQPKGAVGVPDYCFPE